VDRPVAEPEVSVVMAVYHAPLPTLVESVECILRQTFTDFEFLIVDDGNGEEALAYLAAVAARDPRVRVLHNEKNLGLTASLRSAIASARGHLIARQDADDLSRPERLQEQRDLFAASPRLVLAGTWYDTLSENGHVATFAPRNDAPGLRREMFHRNPFCHASTMFRRDAYLQAGGYDAGFRTTQDLDLWFRLARIGDLGMVERRLVTRRLFGDSISHSSKAWRQVANSFRIRWRERGAHGGRFPSMTILGATAYHALITLIPSSWRRHVSALRWRLKR
jgi:glycosyltransferase involved in cell wall biosynthesis